MTSLKSNSNPTFLPDEPIKIRGQDFLSRTNFIESLAHQIIEFDQPDCLVIGIHGPWGSGKSSFLNLLTNELEEKSKNEDAPLVVVRFNPWNFSSIDQLIFMFFNEIKHAVGQRDKSKIAKKIGKKLENLGKLLSPLQVFPAFGGFPILIQKFGEGLKKTADSKDLIDLKKELNHLFEEYGKKLIIFIDDIDRLDKESMCLMFRLIRLNADFSNTIYVLAFDRQVVEKVLEEEQGISGREYLEKIIQVNFDLPIPEHSRVTLFLIEEMIRTLPEMPEEEFDEHRWLNIYHAGFKSFFETIRDVKRYVNALQLTFPLVFKEVNPVDFLALEAIRVFCPDVYSDLAKKKEILTKEDLVTQKLYGEPTNKKEKKEFEKLFAKAGREGYELTVCRICLQLFPQIADVYDDMSGGDGLPSTWRKEKRICAKDFFDKYFLLGVPEGGISEVEVRDALQKTGDRIAFVNIFRGFNKHGLARKFLERMDDLLNEIPVENTKTIIEALLDVGDELPERTTQGFLDLGPQNQIYRIVYQLLKRIDDHLRRVEILKDAVKKGTGLYSVVRLISLIDHRKEREKEFIISEEDLDKLKAIALKRIRQEANEGKLMNRPNFGYILSQWRNWSNSDEPEDYASCVASTDEGIIKLLVGFVSENYSETLGDYYGESKWSFYKNELSKFINMNNLLPKIQSIKQKIWELLSDREKFAIDAFLKSEKDQLDE